MARRRRSWIFANLTPRKLANLVIACAQFVLKSERPRAWPVIVKVDITPLCNLRCTVCVHATPSEASSPELRRQSFDRRQLMSVEQFRRIVNEISGKSIAISMYYLGDPLMHPDLDRLCATAWKGDLNTHVSTNFSLSLSDERIRRLVESGLTHLTVCVDGLRQELYERTRVGGRIDLVLNNLERLMACRRRLHRAYPKVEVQYILFRHNLNDLEQAKAQFEALGIDQFTTFWGDLGNYTDSVPGRFTVLEPKDNFVLPRCFWPHFMLQIKYDGDVIPCCSYRQGLQYTDSDDKRVVGNVFRDGVWKVWDSREYRRLRRLVSNPQRVRREVDLSATFCHGCAALFATDAGPSRLANQYNWEDVYEYDGRRDVVRKGVLAAPFPDDGL
jgi:MoaA/NifB/PqqE/SkfB family radical SAM enzyme